MSYVELFKQNICKSFMVNCFMQKSTLNDGWYKSFSKTYKLEIRENSVTLLKSIDD